MTQFRVKTPMHVPGFLNAIDRMFNDDYQFSFGMYPPVNITEHDKAYQITLMVPGLNKSDFKISVENNLLTISYEKAEEKSEESTKFIKKEFAFRSFKRSFTVNEGLDTENISATYENGLLSVSVPKTETQEAKAKTIEVL
ncbi:MAG TPA: Hsp20/alpha crystallin family protein [Chitinophagaceae bacterium]|nr:Hsp20/alpha crystallin family protein [Chitinophagaceae bacterium]